MLNGRLDKHYSPALRSRALPSFYVDVSSRTRAFASPYIRRARADSLGSVCQDAVRRSLKRGVLRWLNAWGWCWCYTDSWVLLLWYRSPVIDCNCCRIWIIAFLTLFYCKQPEPVGDAQSSECCWSERALSLTIHTHHVQRAWTYKDTRIKRIRQGTWRPLQHEASVYQISGAVCKSFISPRTTVYTWMYISHKAYRIYSHQWS